MNAESIKLDGRKIRAQKTYDDAHKKLIESAVELLNNPLISHEKITISQIARHAGVSAATAYNHFPENKLDIYGSIFNLGFKDVAEELNEFLKSSPQPDKVIIKFLDTIANKVVELGNAIRIAWFEVREIQASGKWIEGEPYDVLYSLCSNYDPAIADELADEIFQMFNGATFLWLRYDSNYPVWSKYTDDWYIEKVNQIFDKATKIHK
ncbi:TetR/AcrR family transcriptional regulator [Candidatus Actinomarina sp. HD9-500m-PIT-SAG01]|nr:TetR/AcrR family transcriptional regulator [Candidatus Actinomarina sp. HD9-500m-PIT-SAG01]